MKEMLQSKAMLGFVVLILGFIFLNCGNDVNLEENSTMLENDKLIAEIN